MKNTNTTNMSGAVLGASSAGYRKINRFALADTLTSLRNTQQLPSAHVQNIDKWLADDGRLIRSVSEAELEKLEKSLQPIIDKIKAKEAPLCDAKPSADTHSLADSFDSPANPEAQAEGTLNYGAGKSAKGQVELRIDLAKIRAAIDNPRHVPKDEALWVVPSGVASRAVNIRKQPIKSALLMIDLDDMEGRTLQNARAALYAVAGMPVQHDIYTTYRATEADQRCRIVIPLAKVIESEDAYQGALQWLIDGMAAQGIKVDPLLDIKRLLYLPNHADGTFYDKLSNREGVCLTPGYSTPRAMSAEAGEGSVAGNDDAFASLLSSQEIADAREVITAMREKGLHLSHGHGVWHRVAAALWRYGAIGETLFNEFSIGDAEYSAEKCAEKLAEKRRVRVNSGIGALFAIAAEYGIANPATGRKPAATSRDVEQLASMTVGEHKDAGTNLVTNLFSKLTLTKKDADAMVEAKFWVPNMVVRGHITSYPAPANGGKTTLFIHLCEQMVRNGASVFYINVDSPPDKLKQQQAHADSHGYKLIAPDSLTGVGIKDAHNVLEQMADSPVSLSNVVIILDTLKKFVPVLDKGEGKAFFNLLRRITAKGATICLLSHTNKYLTKDGDLIYEGTGDQRTDIDNMIYIHSSEDVKTGIINLTTEPDKVRAIIKPRSFRIHKHDNLRVEECAELLPTINKDERLVLEKAMEAIAAGTATTQKNLLDRLLEETPFSRDKLRAALFKLSDGDAAPLIGKHSRANNALQYSVRGEQTRISDFD